jgi:hypothetical protein
MTRLGMVFLGLMAMAAAIGVGFAVATDNSQDTKPAPLTVAQVAELSPPAKQPDKVQQSQPQQDEDDGATPEPVPQDGDGEDGPGS